MLKLPHWIITDLFPSFYDSESKSTIEMTGKIYAKMNELIDDYNSFVDKINKTVSDFVSDKEHDYEVFETAIRQEYQNFMDVIDLKVNQQDKKIKDAVDYMKTNLNNYVTESVNKMINGGEIDALVAKALNNLTDEISIERGRIDTLIVNNTESLTGYSLYEFYREFDYTPESETNFSMNYTIQPESEKDVEILNSDSIEILFAGYTCESSHTGNSHSNLYEQGFIQTHYTDEESKIDIVLPFDSVPEHSHIAIKILVAYKSKGIVDEIEDLRIGIDGVTYETAGEAIRTQLQNLIDRIESR